MKHRPLYVGALLVAFVSAIPVAALDYGDGNARVRMVTSVARPEAGSTFLLGVHFEIRPGWHIYWRNPGGAGLATDIQWRLPDGFAGGPLRWPLPVYFTQSGDIPGYGYVDSVVLASEISVQQDVDEMTPMTVGAKVSLLACKDVCVIDANGKLVYIGAIDDDPRGDKGDGATNYVAAALDQVLAGDTVTTAETKPYGCSVKYKK